MLKTALTLLLFLAPVSLLAQSSPGPRLESAITVWLSGDDATSLPALSALAHEGNETAAIFLARIERSSSLTSDYVQGLTRAERIGLFRSPGGLSGQSWLAVLQTTNPLAQAFLESKSVKTRLDGLIRLMELGERRASLVAYLAYYRGGVVAPFIRRSAETGLPPELELIAEGIRRVNQNEVVAGWRQTMGVNWLHPIQLPNNVTAGILGEDPAKRWEVSTILNATLLPPLGRKETNSLINGFVLAGLPDPQLPIPVIDAWLSQSPATNRIHQTCAQICPAETGACSRAVYAQIPLFAGIALGSPMETLIPDARYFSSPRATLDLAAIWANKSLDHVRALQESACFAGFIAPELSRR